MKILEYVILLVLEIISLLSFIDESNRFITIIDISELEYIPIILESSITLIVS